MSEREVTAGTAVIAVIVSEMAGTEGKGIAAVRVIGLTDQVATANTSGIEILEVRLEAIIAI